jgi:hypothetical protein
MAYRRTYADLVLGVRDNLDEATASFWTADTIKRTMTRAADIVWLELRKIRADYFLTSRASTDGSVTIYGDSYATSNFAIVAGTKEYTLPADLAEVKLIECITSGYEDVEFIFRDLTDAEFRRARMLTTNQSPRVFYADVIGERTLTIAPASDTALDLRIWYVPATVIVSSVGASQRSFEASTDELVLPHPLYMAVEEVATWRAQLMDRDANSQAWVAVAQASVARFMGAHARQSSDDEVVRGVFE